MEKKAKDLAAYAAAQLGKPYWYATFGNTASAQLLSSKRKQYPAYYTEGKYKTGWKQQYGQRVHDCVGLIKGFLWSETPDSAPKYKASQDVSANGMYNVCTEKGKIGTLPELPGVLVFFDGHVGVYIGGGEVIEARGHDYGVVKTKLKGRPWTTWGKCPWVEYSAEEKPAEPAKDYYSKYTGSGVSIVDALKSLKIDSSMAFRKQIAAANGIANYSGTPAQNIRLLDLLRSGKLLKA